MAVEYSTQRCRGARLPWKDCDRTVSCRLPFDTVSNQHDGIRVFCGECGTSNFISHDDKHEPTTTGEVA